MSKEEMNVKLKNIKIELDALQLILNQLKCQQKITNSLLLYIEKTIDRISNEIPIDEE